MAVKKSELYSSLWASCDELRGGMDASQYKDYVLVMLFVKYVSDKYAGQLFAPIEVPKGASFRDMAALKGDPQIGDKLNKLVLGPLFKANGLSTPPDFNDATKLGTGKEMVQRLTNLIAIFENPELDFSKNRAEGDDLLGDAYEYLMRHFATLSGKSKGQFYTPAEVSRVMASILGIHDAKTTRSTLLPSSKGLSTKNRARSQVSYPSSVRPNRAQTAPLCGLLPSCTRSNSRANSGSTNLKPLIMSSIPESCSKLCGFRRMFRYLAQKSVVSSDLTEKLLVASFSSRLCVEVQISPS